MTQGDWTPESAAVNAQALYAWHPNGVTGSKLAEALAKAGAGAGTARNWSTLTKILERTRT